MTKKETKGFKSPTEVDEKPKGKRGRQPDDGLERVMKGIEMHDIARKIGFGEGYAKALEDVMADLHILIQKWLYDGTEGIESDDYVKISKYVFNEFQKYSGNPKKYWKELKSEKQSEIYRKYMNKPRKKPKEKRGGESE